MNMDSIRTRLAADLQRAMKDKNLSAVQALRSLMAALDNAEAVAVAAPAVMPMAGGIAGATEGVGSTEVARRALAEEEVREIIRREIDEMAGAAALLENSGRPELGQLREKIRLLESYL